MFEYLIDAEKSFIGAYFLEDMSLCDDLIFHFEQDKTKFAGEVQRGKDTKIDKEEKDSTDTNLPTNSVIGSRYVRGLQQALTMYNIKYPFSDRVASYNIEAINLQKYDPNGGYKLWHSERTSSAAPGGLRHLVFMTYLNDITDKGETEFLYQKLKVKPKKGLTLIWPADWTHTHRGIPSPTQTKYIATGWYAFTETTQ